MRYGQVFNIPRKLHSTDCKYVGNVIKKIKNNNIMGIDKHNFQNILTHLLYTVI